MNLDDFARLLIAQKLGSLHENLQHINRCCPDQDVGALEAWPTLGKPSHGWRTIKRNPVANASAFTKRLVLVLESPHIDEFKEPCGPARGATGWAILQHSVAMLQDADIDGRGYSLILMNAIQFPCSLGYGQGKDSENHRGKLRDRVFQAAWPHGQASFKERLRSYLRSGDIVWNACTQGSSKHMSSLRNLVQTAIVAAAPSGTTLLCSPHPSSWNRNKQNRRIIRL